MDREHIITGQTKEEIRQQLAEQFNKEDDLLDYATTINFKGRQVFVEIDIDLGGGFESGYETTTLLAPLHTQPPFRFAIHKEHFSDEIGKFFGMQDVELGYDEFDKKLIIKTNSPEKLHDVFADPASRGVFQNLEDFTFGTTTHHTSDADNRAPFLELTIETGITNADRLMEIFEAFYTVLVAVENDGNEGVEPAKSTAVIA
jgi:hypothetical protein